MSTKDKSKTEAQHDAKLPVMRSFFSRLWNCKIWSFHDWTSDAAQGIPPKPEHLKSIEGFWNYATMYCKRCGHISNLSKRVKCNYKN